MRFQGIKAVLYKDGYVDLKIQVGKPNGSPVCGSEKKCATAIDRKRFAKNNFPLTYKCHLP